jgi:hypothetical protein
LRYGELVYKRGFCRPEDLSTRGRSRECFAGENEYAGRPELVCAILGPEFG